MSAIPEICATISAPFRRIRMSKHLYFLGIGGTLMGSLAQLAKQMGFEVSGSDGAIYPPMSDQLSQADIRAFEGFDPAQLEPPPDQIIVGNAGLPRGNAAIEYILERNLSYTSGAEWLGNTVLRNRWVLAVAGTHGKTCLLYTSPSPRDRG